MKSTTLRRLIEVSAVVALVAVSPARSRDVQAAQAPAGEQASATIYALGPDGKPVTTLKPEQVTVRFNGKPRTVRSLELVSVSGGAPAGGGANAEPLPPPFGENAGGGAGGGRTIFLAVSEETIRPGSERTMKDAMIAWVNSLPAGDRIALSTMSRGIVRTDFGATRAALKEAIGKIGSRQNSAPAAGCRTRDALDELRGAITGLGGAGGTPIIVFFTGEIAASESDRDCELTVANFDRVAAAQAGTNVQIFVVLPEIVSSMTGIQNLAGVTSSPILNMSAGAEAVLQKIAAETSAYYIVNFDVEASERTGQPMRFEVKSDAATIRAPKDLAVAKPAAKPDPKNMVKETRVYRDLPLRVAGVPMKGADATKVNVLVQYEPAEPGTKLAAASIGMVSGDGKVSTVTLQSAELQRPVLAPVPMAVAPGKYRLRIAAVDAAGRAGTADFDLNAEITPAGPMQLSGLIFGVLKETTLTNRLSFRGDDAEATILFYLWGGTTKPISAAVEVLKPNGDAAAPSLMPQVSAQGAGAFLAMAKLPLESLPPGDYQVKVEFTVEGETPGVLTRTLRKEK